MLSNEDIEQYRSIYKKFYNISLNGKEANAQAYKLFNLLKLIVHKSTNEKTWGNKQDL
jgi:hypothetical protein